MSGFFIDTNDLEEMPEETRERLLEYMMPKIGVNWWVTDKNMADAKKTIIDKPPTLIPVELAIAVLATLKDQGLKAARFLLSNNGSSRSELAKKLKISEKSVNGVIGSINRRYSFRLDKTKYDRKKCRVIYYEMKTGEFGFVNDGIRNTFKYALDALDQVAKDGLSYEQYNYENVFFETGWLDNNHEYKVVRLNPAAIDEFMGEKGQVHEFSEGVDGGFTGGADISLSFTGDVLTGHERSLLVFDGGGMDNWFDIWLGEDGNLVADENDGQSRTPKGDENE